MVAPGIGSPVRASFTVPLSTILLLAWMRAPVLLTAVSLWANRYKDWKANHKTRTGNRKTDFMEEGYMEIQVVTGKNVLK